VAQVIEDQHDEASEVVLGKLIGWIVLVTGDRLPTRWHR
jgi:hypothetical protein